MPAPAPAPVQMTQLAGLKLEKLVRKAREVGVDEEALDGAADEDDAKAATIKLIVAQIDVNGV